MRTRILVISLVCFLVINVGLVSAIPQLISLQGKLTTGGIPLGPSESKEIEFNIYNSETAAYDGHIWRETQTVVMDSDGQGTFSVLLGSQGSPITLDFIEDYWLGVKVGTDDEMTPRKQIASSGYAFKAEGIYGDLDMGGKLIENIGDGHDFVAGGLVINDASNDMAYLQLAYGGTPHFLLRRWGARNKIYLATYDGTDNVAIRIDFGDGAQGSGYIKFYENLDMSGKKITNVGDVGIGTTDPGDELHVYENINAKGASIRTENPSSGGGAYTRIWLRQDGSHYGGLWHYSSGYTSPWTSATRLLSVGGPLILNAHTGQPILFYSGGSTERMRITSDGKVGIGTTSPTAKLDVAGDVKIGGKLDMGGNQIINVGGFQSSIYDETGLIGHWKFNEGYGTIAYDGSPSGNDGTLINNPTWTNAERYCTGLSFRGSNDCVRCSLNLPNSIEMTVEVWVKPSSLIPGTIGMLVFEGDATRYRDLFFALNGDGSVEWRTKSEGEGTSFSSPPGTVRVGEWFHIVGLNTATTKKIFVNGEEVATIDGTFNQNGYHDVMSIGGIDGTGGYNFNGIIDEVNIYTRALPLAEIQYLYNIGKN